MVSHRRVPVVCSFRNSAHRLPAVRVLHAQTEDDDLEVCKFPLKTRTGADVNQANQLQEGDSIRLAGLIEAQMSKPQGKKKTQTGQFSTLKI